MIFNHTNKDNKMYYGQYGQDSIINQFFDQKKIKNGFFVDVGASDGIRFSNSYFLELNGWDGICVEAHPDYYDLLKKNRKAKCCWCAAGDTNQNKCEISLNYRGSLTTLNFDLEKELPNSGYSPFYGDRNDKKISGFLNGRNLVPMLTIDSIIKNFLEIEKIDLLCIDIDGSEISAFKGLNLELWKPSLLVLEHTMLGHDFMDNFAKKNGYLKGKTVGSDNFYVKNDNDLKILNQIEIDGPIFDIKHVLD